MMMMMSSADPQIQEPPLCVHWAFDTTAVHFISSFGHEIDLSTGIDIQNISLGSREWNISQIDRLATGSYIDLLELCTSGARVGRGKQAEINDASGRVLPCSLQQTAYRGNLGHVTHHSICAMVPHR